MEVEKLNAIDEQIRVQQILYDRLIDIECSFKDDWCVSSLWREKEIFDKIHELQNVKTRLITGEKPPEIVYIDKEVPKYITTKEVHVHRSVFAYGFLGTSVLVYILLGLAYWLDLFRIVIK